jgi:hypothetical protein
LRGFCIERLALKSFCIGNFALSDLLALRNNSTSKHWLHMVIGLQEQDIRLWMTVAWMGLIEVPGSQAKRSRLEQGKAFGFACLSDFACLPLTLALGLVHVAIAIVQ